MDANWIVNNNNTKPDINEHVLIKFPDGEWTDAYYVGFDIAKEIPGCGSRNVWWSDEYDVLAIYPIANTRWPDELVVAWRRVE